VSVPVLPDAPLFPARRSSDLWDLREIRQLDYAGAVMLWQAWGEKRPDVLYLRDEQARMFDRLQNIPPIPDKRRSNLFLPVSTLRSEEHTSELQSRENFVCRLL